MFTWCPRVLRTPTLNRDICTFPAFLIKFSKSSSLFAERIAPNRVWPQYINHHFCPDMTRRRDLPAQGQQFSTGEAAADDPCCHCNLSCQTFQWLITVSRWPRIPGDLFCHCLRSNRYWWLMILHHATCRSFWKTTSSWTQARIIPRSITLYNCSGRDRWID